MIKQRTLNEYRQTKDSVYEVTNVKANESEGVKLFVWTDRSPSKTLINLNSEELKKAVSSGHDNDWVGNVDEVNRNILEGREYGITQIERYNGAVKDVVYWELGKSLFTQEDMSELIELVRKTPNDWNLGQKIREYFIKKTLV
jgi:hypothetical protein